MAATAVTAAAATVLIAAAWLAPTALGAPVLPLDVVRDLKLEARPRDAPWNATRTLAPMTEIFMNGSPSSAFVTTIQVGDQDMEVIVDTGSTTLAVASDDCTNCDVPGGYRLGPTAKALNARVQGIYGDDSGWSGYATGAAHCGRLHSRGLASVLTAYFELALLERGRTFGRSVVEDIVTVGGVAVRMRLAAITGQNKFFDTNHVRCKHQPCRNQGILGLGYSAIALPHTDAFMDKLALRGVVPDLFAVQMCGSHGHLWLGGYNGSVALTAPIYTRLVEKSYYVVAIHGVGIGDSRLRLSALTDLRHAVVDTGTTQFAMPRPVLMAINDLLNRNELFTAVFGADFLTSARCQTAPSHSKAQLNAQLPRLRILLDEVALDMHAVSSYLQEMTRDGVTYYCPGIGVTTASSFILGWSVLNQFLTVFDRARARIGFASLHPSACADD